MLRPVSAEAQASKAECRGLPQSAEGSDVNAAGRVPHAIQLSRSPPLAGNNAPPAQCHQGAPPRARELPGSASFHAHSVARNT